MKAVLFYPPYANPRTPYLSLPTLSSFIKRLGHVVTIRDLNLDLLYDSSVEDAIKGEGLDANEGELRPGPLPGLEEARGLILGGAGNSPGIEKKAAKERLKWAYDSVFKKHEANFGVQSIGEMISFSFEKKDDLIDAFYTNKVIPWLLEARADLVGLSIPYPSQMGPSLRLARLIKERLPEVFVVIGGPHVTKFANDLASVPRLFELIDAMVTFEGERPMKALLDSLQKNGGLAGVTNLIYSERGRAIHNPTTAPEPINHLPTPDFQGLHLDRYLLDEMMLPLITSRGCHWHKCSFCTYREIRTQAAEPRDISLVIEDMKHLSENYQCRSFRIVDDALSPSRCRALSNEILAAGLDITWWCAARFEKGFTPELCRLMGKAGCYKVAFGLESYNQRILNLMKKGIRVEQVKPVLEDLRAAGVKAHLNIMIGFPTETREESEETKRFLLENRELYATFGVQTFNLEAGTEVDREPEKFGITKVFRDEKIRHGFRYGYRFTAKSGMSWDAAEEVTKEIRKIKNYPR